MNPIVVNVLTDIELKENDESYSVFVGGLELGIIRVMHTADGDCLYSPPGSNEIFHSLQNAFESIKIDFNCHIVGSVRNISVSEDIRCLKELEENGNPLPLCVDNRGVE